MLPQIFDRKKTDLDIVIDELVVRMQKTTDPDAYSTYVEQLVKLNAVRNTRRVSPDVLFNVAGSIAGVLLVLGYEHGHVITSKAFSLVRSIR